MRAALSLNDLCILSGISKPQYNHWRLRCGVKWLNPPCHGREHRRFEHEHVVPTVILNELVGREVVGVADGAALIEVAWPILARVWPSISPMEEGRRLASYLGFGVASFRTAEERTLLVPVLHRAPGDDPLLAGDGPFVANGRKEEPLFPPSNPEFGDVVAVVPGGWRKPLDFVGRQLDATLLRLDMVNLHEVKRALWSRVAALGFDPDTSLPVDVETLTAAAVEAPSSRVSALDAEDLPVAVKAQPDGPDGVTLYPIMGMIFRDALEADSDA